MVIMALDHVRDLMHVTSLTQSPTDLSTTTPLLFLSRWITHLCAPTFVFLSGTSVWLSTRKTEATEIAKKNLLIRGLWLIFLEFTLVNFALWFDFQFRILMLQVIAAIGTGFILLSFLLKTSAKTIGVIGALILATHNMLQFIPVSENAFLNAIRNLLFAPGLQQVSPDFIFFTAYPLVPWIAIMMLGYSLGSIFERSAVSRNKTLVQAGVAFLLIFLVLRILNIYGDPVPWQVQKNGALTFLSFINVTKYPPSLLFTLLFLGITFLSLRFSENLPEIFRRVLAVYGRVPLFYYLLHLYFIRIAVFMMVFAQGYHWKDLLFGPFQFGRPASGSGLGLAATLLVWIGIVALLYPLCLWYGNYKQKNARNAWMKYL